jgi:hypothetical protein
MSTHIINFPGADIHTTTLTSVSNVSVGENLDVASNLTVSGDVGIGTTAPQKTLEVAGPLRITDGLSNVCDFRSPTPSRSVS